MSEDHPNKEYTPGELPVPNEDEFGHIQEFVPFEPRHFKFLEEYNKDLDLSRALKESGVTKVALQKNSKMARQLKREMKEINDAWMKAVRLTTKSAAAKHLDLLQKIEGDYDLSDLEVKSKFAPTLAKMSETSMKATNHFDDANDKTSGLNLQINIDLGDSNEPKEIDAEIIEHEEKADR